MNRWIRKSPKRSQPFLSDAQVHLDPNEEISEYLEQTLTFIDRCLGASDDFKIRRFRIFGRYDAAIVYFSSLCDQEMINRDLMKPLFAPPLDEQRLMQAKLPEVIWNDYVYMSSAEKETKLAAMFDLLMRGYTMLLMDRHAEAFLFDMRRVEKRAIEQPQTEQVIRGARDGFIESLETNVVLLRRRIQSYDLRVQTLKLGRRTKTEVAICYVESIANPELVEEMKNRIQQIDVSTILDVGYIEQFIEDYPFSPFPQIQNTERPDKTVASLLEGRVAILADGSPFALIAPVTFSQFYQTPDDYTERFMAGMFGLYGGMVGFILIANHMLFLDSFGVPYMTPFVPGNKEGAKDALIRGPLWWMPKRPRQLYALDQDRLPVPSAKPATQPIMSDPVVKGEMSLEEQSENNDN